MTNKKTAYPSSLRSSGRRTDGYQTIRFASAIQIPENGNVILYTTDDGKSQVALYSRDGRVWPDIIIDSTLMSVYFAYITADYMKSCKCNSSRLAED